MIVDFGLVRLHLGVPSQEDKPFTLVDLLKARDHLIEASAPPSVDGYYTMFLHPLQNAIIRMWSLADELMNLLKTGRSRTSRVRGIVRRAHKLAGSYPYKTAEEINDLHDRIQRMTRAARRAL